MSRKVYPERIARASTGIRAQDLRTLVRKAWWARRWIAAIESFRLGARLGRGRQYAVNGQVTRLAIAGPHVEATVLGSRPDPYRVTLDATTPGEAGLARIMSRVTSRPALLARILSDDLPTQVEALFAEEKCPLFPVASPKPPYDIVMRCSCPDWMKPCKHIAAVLFLLGEEIVRRPATLLAFRGVDVEAFFDRPAAPKDVPDMPAAVFSADPVPEGASAPIAAQTDPAAIVRRLGPVPFWRGVNRCTDALCRMYARFSEPARAAGEGAGLDARAPS